MTFKLILFLGLFITITIKTLGQTTLQCDSITVHNGVFDKIFQDEYSAIKADTVLAVRHCGSTNGCGNTFGLLCWKVNGEFYFKKIQRKDNQIEFSTELDKKLKNKLIEFYEKRVFEKTGELEPNSQYWADDGPATFILFKADNYCWRFDMSISNSKDIRVVWTRNLLYLMW